MGLKKRNWLIAYDICDEKRLQRVHRLCKSFAIPLQNSVFITQATQLECDQFCEKLAAIIDHNTDDIRFYVTDDLKNMILQGTNRLPESLANYILYS